MSKKTIFISPERRLKPHGKYILGEIYETDVCYEIARMEEKLLHLNGFDTYIAPQEWTMPIRVNYANGKAVDYYQCIHTNAGGGKGSGTECLYANNPESIRANEITYKYLTELFPSKRGLKDYSNFYENRYPAMVTCYPEIAFHDNPRDAEFILNNKEVIAEALAKSVCEYFGVPFQKKPAKMYGVVEQVVALSDKDRAEQFAKQKNSEGTDSYFKVIDIE